MNEVDTENLLSESSVEWAAHAVCSFVSSAVPTIVFLCSCFFFLVVPDATEVQGSKGLVAAEGKTKTHGNDAIHAQLARDAGP